jgi:biopolymer transport protein ExbB
MLELFKNAGWVAYPLGIFSVLALAILLERLFTLARLKSVENEAIKHVESAVTKGDTAVLRDAQFASAPVVQVVNHLLPLGGATQESYQQAQDIALAQQRMRLRRYLGTLATIGSTAPFIGLFGTVLGVIAAFEGMQTQGLSGEAMAGGISEALSATAVGLLVAIPAIMAYNYLLGRIQAQMLEIHGHVARLAPMIRRSGQEE